MSIKWIIGRFRALFSDMVVFCQIRCFVFDVNLLCLFMWILSEIYAVLCGFMIWNLSEICYDMTYYFCMIDLR